MFTGSGCEAYADDERLGPVFEAHESIDLNKWGFVLRNTFQCHVLSMQLPGDMYSPCSDRRLGHK